MKKRTIRLIQFLFVGVMALAFLVSSGAPLPAAAQTVYPFDVRDQPIYLIASYYNALELRDYARAYSYWEGNAPGGATYAQFVQGFANVQTVHALARLPVAQVSGALYLVPVLTFPIAWVWLGEVPSPLSFAGGVLALIGVLLVQLRSN